MNVNSRIARANFTGYASGTIASFTGLRVSLVDIKSYISPIQSGSGTPSPDNIRPISGVSECNVVRCGVNGFNEVWSNGYINASGTFVPTSAYSTTDYIPVKKGKSYYVKATVINADRANVAFYDSSKTFIKLTSSTMGYNTQFTVSEDCSYIRIILTNANTSRENFSFNHPATDTSYHAYTGNTYTIQLGDTYYGGVLDVTTGLLTVTHANIASYNGEPINEPWICSEAVYSEGTTPPTGSQVVYELATPITVQLTPSQIEQLLGVNNVFADCGNVEVYYVTI